MKPFLYSLCARFCVDLKKKLNETKNKQIYLEKKSHNTSLNFACCSSCNRCTNNNNNNNNEKTTTGKWACMYQLLAEYDYDQAIKISVSYVFKFIIRSTTNEKKTRNFSNKRRILRSISKPIASQ